jgi:hypothetical protein
MIAVEAHGRSFFVGRGKWLSETTVALMHLVQPDGR